MTMELLCKIIEENNIPRDVHFVSDSGWECEPTEMDGVFYHWKNNTIVFTQGVCSEREYEQAEEWEILYAPDLIKLDGLEVYPTYSPMAYGLTETFKSEIKAAGDFESYYGIQETDDLYNEIDLRWKPLFYSINIKGNMIGYIGFNGDENILEPEIYIFKQYRNKGYGSRVLKKMIDMTFKEGLMKKWREENDEGKLPRYIWKEKKIFPSKFVSTVRVENEYSRRMMTACGFNENNGVAVLLGGFITGGKGIAAINVKKYYLSKENYLQL